MSGRARGACASSDAIAEAAAEKHLAGGGSALGAVLCGFFAAAGSHAGVLLAPISILVAGIGAGGRAFDGRLRQPGLSAKRPRGFLKDDVIPMAARVGAHSAVAAAAVAYGYESQGTLATVVRPGVEQAQRAGAEARAALLERLCSVGAVAMSEASFVRPLLRVASSVEGGLLTPADFSQPSLLDYPARERTSKGTTLLEVPWAGEPVSKEALSALGAGAAVLAVDVHGLFAVLAYRRVESGLFVKELELICPLSAAPTRRGVARVAPGKRLSAPAPIAIACDPARGPIEVLAEPALARVGSKASTRRLAIRRDPSTRFVEIVKDRS